MSDYQGLPLTPEFEEVLRDCGVVVPISDETTDRELDTIEEQWERRTIEAE